MNHKILVYDDFNDYFRDLNMSNYNDDIIVGTVLLRREAIKVLKKYYIICGYVLIGKEGNLYPIDIREEDIAIFEGTYNCIRLHPENKKMTDIIVPNCKIQGVAVKVIKSLE